MLRRQRAIEIVPGSKPLRWRRYDVPQHLAPETSDALRFCAVKGDLELLDRRHRSTIEARPSQNSPAKPPCLPSARVGRADPVRGSVAVTVAVNSGTLSGSKGDYGAVVYTRETRSGMSDQLGADVPSETAQAWDSVRSF